MEPDIRYRAAALLIVVALLAGGFLFLDAAKRYGEVQLPWADLPVEVREAVRREAGPEPAIVQVEKGPSSPGPTFLIMLEHPDGRRQRLRLRPDGSRWQPEQTPPPPSSE